MGIVQAFAGALGGTFADQWKEIITAGEFDEHTVIYPGIRKSTNAGRGTNYRGSDGVVTNGSKIYVPENTACFIFSQSGIEEIITEPGGYKYKRGQDSVLNGSRPKNAIIGQARDRFAYGGISSDYKQIAFVNLREIRDIKFGTKGAQVYHDSFYGTDLEFFAYGSLAVQVTNPVTFIRNYVPANVNYYTFDNPKARSQILAEFLHSFIVALNSLSGEYRISEIPSQANAIANAVINDDENAGTWEERFGFKLAKVAIENIELSAQSRELVRQYSENRMRVIAYNDVSQRSSNIAAQQQIAEGIKNNGLGDAGGTIFAMNMAQSMGAVAEQSQTLSFDKQVDQLMKLKELLDAGILTQDEFDAKKKDIMGL